MEIIKKNKKHKQKKRLEAQQIHKSLEQKVTDIQGVSPAEPSSS